MSSSPKLSSGTNAGTCEVLLLLPGVTSTGSRNVALPALTTLDCDEHGTTGTTNLPPVALVLPNARVRGKLEAKNVVLPGTAGIGVEVRDVATGGVHRIPEWLLQVA